MLLSICMMVKNEEENLTHCLESVQNILRTIESELIIVDTGSTDNTVEIAKKYTSKVYFHPWENDFSAMRNITISYAKGKWLFVLDADEVVADDRGIIEFFKQNKTESKFNALCIPLRNFNLKTDETSFTDINAVRFFKNDGNFHYESIIHELPKFKEPVGSLTGIIHHYGYVNDDPILMAKKYERTVALLKKSLSEAPDNIYHRYQLSVSYGMYGDWESSKQEALLAYENLKRVLPAERNTYFYLYGQLMLLYKYFQEHEKTIAISLEALTVREKDIDAYFYLADAYICLDKRAEAIPYLEKYLELVKQYLDRTLFINLDTKLETLKFKTKCLSNLVYLLDETEQYDEILSVYNTYKGLLEQDEHTYNTYVMVIKSALHLKSYKFIHEIYFGSKAENRQSICEALENQLVYLDFEDLKMVYKVLSDKKDPYGQINNLRLLLQSNEKVNDLETKRRYILELPHIYGDLVYYYAMKLQDESLLVDWLGARATSLDLQSINKMMHITQGFEAWAKVYLEKAHSHQMGEWVVMSNIQKYILLQGIYNNQVRESLPIFYRHVEYKVQILNGLYRKEFIEVEKNWVGLESNEDQLCLYLDKAISGPDFEAASNFKKALPLAGDLLPYVHIAIFEKEAQMSQPKNF